MILIFVIIVTIITIPLVNLAVVLLITMMLVILMMIPIIRTSDIAIIRDVQANIFMITVLSLTQYSMEMEKGILVLSLK